MLKVGPESSRYNLSAQFGNRVSQEQANTIMAAAQTNFDDVFRDALRKAGYEVVTTTGPDVLRVNSSILDLDVNAPLGQSLGQTTWIITAGDAALIVEVRDTVTNAILGRVADRRATQDIGQQLASSTTTLRFSPALHHVVRYLRQGARRIEIGVAGTEGSEAQSEPLSCVSRH
jgi:hypothetical protein